MVPTEILAEQHCHRHAPPAGAAGAARPAARREPDGRRESGRQGASSRAATVAQCGRHARADPGGRRFPQAGPRHHRRAAPLRRPAAAGAARKKGDAPARARDDGDADPAHAGADLYGDLDVSVIDELPPGRKPIRTHWKTDGRSATQVYTRRAAAARGGPQVYVVCPLIEESEKLQAKSATQLSEHIAANVFPQYRVGLLHGQMKPDEKESVMARFKAQRSTFWSRRP